MANNEISCDLKLTGFTEFAQALDPARFQRFLQRRVRSAMYRNGLVLRKAIRQNIRSAIPPQNAALTIFIKGSRKPLVDRGELFHAVVSTVIRWNYAEVGILRTNKYNNVARTLSQGAVIPVTQRMRNMFALLARVSSGGAPPSILTGRAAELWARRPAQGWRPLNKNTRFIIVPPRPFMRKPFSDKEVIQKVMENWRNAVELACQDTVNSVRSRAAAKRAKAGKK